MSSALQPSYESPRALKESALELHTPPTTDPATEPTELGTDPGAEEASSDLAEEKGRKEDAAQDQRLLSPPEPKVEAPPELSPLPPIDEVLKSSASALQVEPSSALQPEPSSALPPETSSALPPSAPAEPSNASMGDSLSIGQSDEIDAAILVSHQPESAGEEDASSELDLMPSKETPVVSQSTPAIVEASGSSLISDGGVESAFETAGASAPELPASDVSAPGPTSTLTNSQSSEVQGGDERLQVTSPVMRSAVVPSSPVAPSSTISEGRTYAEVAAAAAAAGEDTSSSAPTSSAPSSAAGEPLYAAETELASEDTRNEPQLVDDGSETESEGQAVVCDGAEEDAGLHDEGPGEPPRPGAASAVLEAATPVAKPEAVEKKRRRRKPKPTEFVKTPAPSTADAATYKESAGVRGPSVYEVQPRAVKAADTGYNAEKATQNSGPSMFEKPAAPSQADVSFRSAKTLNQKRSVFASHASPSMADVNYSSPVPERPSNSLFVSPPKESTADTGAFTVGLANGAAIHKSIFESAAKPSTAAARACQPAAPNADGPAEFVREPAVSKAYARANEEVHVAEVAGKPFVFESAPKQAAVSAKWCDPVTVKNTTAVYESKAAPSRADAAADRSLESDDEYETDTDEE